jgi:uncharacterized protein
MSADVAGADDPEAEAFEQVCSRLSGFDGRIDAEWVDGYLTALAASWREIAVDEWLSAMCGEAFERAFADPEDVARATQALRKRFEALRRALDPQALLDDPDTLRLAPYLVPWDDTARARLIESGAASPQDLDACRTGVGWAIGFFRAVGAFVADWPDPDPRDELAPLYGDLLLAVSALVRAPGDARLEEYLRRQWTDGAPTREELVDDALFAVQDLRLWWIDHAPRIAPRRVPAAPGRNDPCPCGSGRKYKKCHGVRG